MAVSGADIAAYARTFVGSPYVWAGWEPSGWDCSGFVGYVLGKHFGMKLPGGFVWSGKVHPPVAAMYKTWTKANTVSVAQAGDLCCWITHIGIAIDDNRMVSALGRQWGTIVSPIASSGPPGEPLSIRRINTLAAGADVVTSPRAGCTVGLIFLPYFIVKGVVLRVWNRGAEESR